MRTGCNTIIREWCGTPFPLRAPHDATAARASAAGVRPSAPVSSRWHPRAAAGSTGPRPQVLQEHRRRRPHARQNRAPVFALRPSACPYRPHSPTPFPSRSAPAHGRARLVAVAARLDQAGAQHFGEPDHVLDDLVRGVVRAAALAEAVRRRRKGTTRRGGGKRPGCPAGGSPSRRPPRYGRGGARSLRMLPYGLAQQATQRSDVLDEDRNTTDLRRFTAEHASRGTHLAPCP